MEGEHTGLDTHWIGHTLDWTHTLDSNVKWKTHRAVSEVKKETQQDYVNVKY